MHPVAFPVSVGGFDAGQLFESEVAGFNLWSYSMSDDELTSLSCSDEGNVVSAANLFYSSAAENKQMSYQLFECSECREFVVNRSVF